MKSIRFLPPRSGHLKETVYWSTWDGVFFQMYFALSSVGTAFITAYCLELGMADHELTLLAAASQSVLLCQLFGARVSMQARSYSRRRLVMILAGLSRLSMAMLALLPFVLPRDFAFPAVLLVIVISGICQAVAANIWTAWISDSVPKGIRGRFFARRSFMTNLAGVAIGFAGGLLLDWYDGKPGSLGASLADLSGWRGDQVFSSRMHLFLLILSSATVFSVVSLIFLSRQPERASHPPPQEALEDPYSLAFRQGSFRRLLALGAVWSFAIGIGSQFWSPYMQRELQMTLVEQQIYGLISLGGMLCSLPFWGKAIDRFGNRPAMCLGIILGFLNPMYWLFVSKESHGLLFVEALTSGISWACINLCQMNFVLSLTGPRERQAAAGIYAALCGLFQMAGVLVSGWLMPERETFLFGMSLDPYQVLFLITGCCRLAALLPLLAIAETGSRSLRDFLRQKN
ncbi:MAG: putative rane protein [Verrucomicrobiota bacterium]